MVMFLLMIRSLMPATPTSWMMPVTLKVISGVAPALPLLAYAIASRSVIKPSYAVTSELVVTTNPAAPVGSGNGVVKVATLE